MFLPQSKIQFSNKKKNTNDFLQNDIRRQRRPEIRLERETDRASTSNHRQRPVRPLVKPPTTKNPFINPVHPQANSKRSYHPERPKAITKPSSSATTTPPPTAAKASRPPSITSKRSSAPPSSKKARRRHGSEEDRRTAARGGRVRRQEQTGRQRHLGHQHGVRESWCRGAGSAAVRVPPQGVGIEETLRHTRAVLQCPQWRRALGQYHGVPGVHDRSGGRAVDGSGGPDGIGSLSGAQEGADQSLRTNR